ncbi:MAG: hypothetical protein Q4G61_02485 [Tissierellia bacterium]|nr:hypothetical protein [Tissierellia bacterium]
MEQEKYYSYHNEYMPSIIRWGRVLNLLMVPAMFIPVLAILVVHGIAPNIAGAISGSIAYISFSLPYYFTELIALGPILHIPGTYIGFIAGNTRNICAVATSAALDVTGVKTGTPEGTVMATLATATSVVMKFIVVFLTVVTGGWLLTVLPAGFLTALTYLLPALFGAMWMQWAITDVRLGATMLIIALITNFAYRNGVFSFLPAGGEYMPVLICVLIGYLVAKAMYKKKNNN